MNNPFLVKEDKLQLIFIYLLGFLALWILKPLLGGVLLGLFISYLMEPVFLWTVQTLKWNAEWKKWLLSIVMILLVVLLVLVPAGLIIYGALKEVVLLLSSTSFKMQPPTDLLSDLEDSLSKILSAYDLELPLEDWRQRFSTMLLSVVRYILGYLRDIVFSTPLIVLQGLIFFLSWAFFLVHGIRFRVIFLSYLVPFPETRVFMSRISQHLIRALVLSTLVVAMAQNVIFLTGFLILSMPNLLVWQLVVFICSWVPVIGTAPVALASVGYFLQQGRFGAMIFMALISFIAGFVDQIIRPYFLSRGEELKMGFFWMILALIGGVYQMGVIGLLLGPLILSLIYGFVKQRVNTETQENL